VNVKYNFLTAVVFGALWFRNEQHIENLKHGFGAKMIILYKK